MTESSKGKTKKQIFKVEYIGLGAPRFYETDDPEIADCQYWVYDTEGLRLSRTITELDELPAGATLSPCNEAEAIFAQS